MFTFSSLEDMQAHLAARTAAAMEAMTEEQRSLTWGSYAMMPTVDFLIFGYVLTEEELRLGEVGAGADQEEAEFTVKATRGAMSRGYLFGRWYSLAEPEGELGSNHAVSCWPITSHEFNIAATFGWDGPAIVRKPEGSWLLDAYVAFAEATSDWRVSDPQG